MVTHKNTNIRYYRPSGPRLLAGGPSGLLTSSFAPFGRSGRVTHATVQSLVSVLVLDSVLEFFLIFLFFVDIFWDFSCFLNNFYVFLT